MLNGDSKYIIDDSMFAPGGFIDRLNNMNSEELEKYVLKRRAERASRGDSAIVISEEDISIT